MDTSELHGLIKDVLAGVKRGDCALFADRPDFRVKIRRLQGSYFTKGIQGFVELEIDAVAARAGYSDDLVRVTILLLDFV